ncbi:MAG: hypothetical protein ACI9WC_000889 [Arenicella sp.]|jgi:hypothetical protein
MILLNSLQSNIIKVLTIASIGVFSLNTVPDHHGDAEEKASKAAEMSKNLEATGIVGEAEHDLSAEQLKIKMDAEKAKAELKKMMAKDPKRKPDAI